MFQMQPRLDTRSRRKRLAATAVGMAGITWAMLCFERGRTDAVEDAPAATKEAAITRVERLGGEVRIDGEKPDQPVWAVDFGGKSIDNRDLQVLVGFPALEVLNLADTPIDDDGLRLIPVFKELKELNLSGTKITDAGLTHLLRLKNLKTLDLNHTAITDDGLQQLAPLKQLSRPSVFETKVTEAGLQRLEAAIRAAPKVSEDATADRSRQATASATGLHALGRSALIAARGDVDAQRSAAALLEQALEIEPENDLVRVDLADAYLLLDHELTVTAAIDLLEDALARQPDEDRILVRLVRAYATLQNATDAYRYAELRLKSSAKPEQVLDVALQITSVAAVTGETSRGVELLTAIADSHPDSVGLRLVQAALLVEADRPTARRVLQSIVDRHPLPHPYGVQAARLLAATEPAP